MTVLLVRHAHAMPREAWEENDSSRPLSVRGLRQAEKLVAELSCLGPKEIRTSPLVRCVQTVEPLAASVGLEPVLEPALAEGEGRSALSLLRSLGSGCVVLCSHGDVIPDLLGAVAAEDGVELGRLPRVEKGSVWVLEGGAERFSAARYLPPPG